MKIGKFFRKEVLYYFIVRNEKDELNRIDI